MLREKFNQFGKLLLLRIGVSGCDGVGHTAFGMILEDFPLNGGQGRLDRRELGQHVDAVALAFQHAHHAAHLALDALQPGEALFAAFRKTHGFV